MTDFRDNRSFKMKNRMVSFALVVMVSCVTAVYAAAGGDYSKGEAYQYEAFDGKKLTLYPYVGRHAAILAPSPDLDDRVMSNIIDVLDRTYDYYKEATGRDPELYRSYNGRGTVAVVPETCGFACGYLGNSGIELTPSAFDELYNGVLSDNRYNQAVFYEFGRNFWFYGDKIGYFEPDDQDCITTGYAVFMRLMAMEALGVKPGPFHDYDFDYFKSEVKGMIDRYLADPSYNWGNTLRAGEAPSNPMDLGATDLFASFLFKLCDLFGNDLVNRLWKEMDKRPDAVTTQDAVDNFVLAASAASGKNLTEIFSAAWRWPVSDQAKTEALERFGLPQK